MGDPLLGWPFLTALLVVVLSAIIYLWTSLRGTEQEETSAKRKQLPKGSLGWPLIGETLQFMSSLSSSSPERFIDERRSKYGKVFKTHIFGSRTIVSVDPVVSKYVLHSGADVFVPAYPKTVMDLMGEGSIISVNGSEHRRVHGLVGGFLKSPEFKSHVTEDMQSYLADCMEGWQDGSVVFLQDVAKQISFQVLAKTLLSLETASEVRCLREQLQQLRKGLISLPINIPGFQFYRSLQVKMRMMNFVEDIIKKRRTTKHKETNSDRDVIDVLLNSQTDRQIVHNIIDFLFPGEDSVPILITLVVKYLSDSKDALKQLEEENIALKLKEAHSGEKLQWSDFISLSFTQNVISEALRMANIVNGVYRKAMKDTSVERHFIPQGWCVLPYFRGVHFDRDIFEDPYKFNPWRWQNNDIGGGATYTPFGGGLRLCVGMELSRLEASIFLHNLVTRFKWVAEEDTIINFPIVRMKGRMPIKIKRKA